MIFEYKNKQSGDWRLRVLFLEDFGERQMYVSEEEKDDEDDHQVNKVSR